MHFSIKKHRFQEGSALWLKHGVVLWLGETI
jgi:hypothetical protein